MPTTARELDEVVLVENRELRKHKWHVHERWGGREDVSSSHELKISSTAALCIRARRLPAGRARDLCARAGLGLRAVTEMSTNETPNHGVDLPTARALVRLRFALEHALALARDSSEPGSHIAIVGLDGAIEHALWLVTRAFGADVRPMATRPELVTKVRELLTAAGTQWEPAGGAGVDQVHRARNDAQHAAVQFDPVQLPDWASAVSAYVDDLIESAFARSIFDVSLADAVRDLALSALLRQAEHNLSFKDSGAFQLVCVAFDEARTRWRDQQVHIYGRLMNEVMFQASYPAFGMIDGTVSQDERLADFLEVAPFAIDLGEYLWFLSSRRQQQEVGWTPDPADTRRALNFVSGWIVRWEIFDRGYPLDRWNEHVAGLQPPILGDGDRTQILRAEALMTSEVPGYPARCHLHFWLANVPDGARGPWGNWLPQGLVDAAAELRENIRFDQVQLYLTGQVLLVCDLGFDADVLANVFQRAIEITDQRYREWEANGIRRRQELTHMQAEFARVIDSAQTGQILFGGVEVTERSSDGQPIVWVGLNFGEFRREELGLCVQGFQGAGGVLASSGTLQERIVFDAFELTSESEALLRGVVSRCERSVLRRRELYGRRRLEFQHFQNRIELLFQAGGSKS
jgi:hypothetical protein